MVLTLALLADALLATAPAAQNQMNHRLGDVLPAATMSHTVHVTEEVRDDRSGRSRATV